MKYTEMTSQSERGACATRSVHRSRPQAPPDPEDLCEVATCKGSRRGCPHAVSDTDGLARKVLALLRDLGVPEHICGALTGKVLPHHRIRVAIAACPNACSQPQIKDVGIIAQSVPQESQDKDPCTGCGLCVDICREQAARLVDGVPAIDRETCVNCGACIKACPTHAITAREEGWRLLVGGRLGRHPHLAAELLPLGSEDEVLRALRICLERFVSSGHPGERFSEFVSRTGVDTLRRAVMLNRGIADGKAEVVK